MKRLLSIFAILVCALTTESQAAVVVKKAAPVATKKAEVVDSATSLLPSVIGLVANVKSLQAQQQQLTEDCAPTSDEINTVNELVKEWAKIGETTAEGAAGGLGQPCEDGYSTFVEYADAGEVCYDTFHSSADEGTVWNKFPKASSAKKCEDGNSKKCTTVSNVYDIFDKIPFGEDDYTKSEAKKLANLKEKAARCSDSKIKAAKRELYGGFLTQTLGGIGQSTGAAGTASVLEAVSSMGGSGDIKSMLPSLGTMATSMFDK